MKQFINNKILKSTKCLIIISVLFILVSCSEKVTKYPRVLPSTYLSPEYEDKTFDDASMDICLAKSKHEYNRGLDSITISSIKHFNESFLKHFSDGIKMFSSVTRTGWILYDLDEDFNYDFIDYRIKINSKDYLTISMTDSLSFFIHQSNSDFLLFIHFITVAQNGPTNDSSKMSDYESIVDIDYSIWNTKNSDLITKDRVTTRHKFKRLAGKWPCRGVVLKAASEIFGKLPMFSN